MKRKNQKARGFVGLGEELVEFFIDDALVRSKRLRRYHAHVARAHDALRAVADDAVWKAFLEVEEAMNARTSTELRIVFNRMLAVLAYAIGGSPDGRSPVMRAVPPTTSRTGRRS